MSVSGTSAAGLGRVPRPAPGARPAPSSAAAPASAGSREADAPLHLDEGWVRAPDGVRERSAARVLVLDSTGAVLLVRGHDADEPDRHWWFSVGGGIDPGETPREAAARELREETGLKVDPRDLEGPVLRRSAIFDFAREHCRQHEEFFVLRVAQRPELSRAGWTPLEESFVDEMSWLTADELDESRDEVFPATLGRIVRGLVGGWDGSVEEIGLETDPKRHVAD
ncbi:NUDIX hydrolase [Sanguibacter sp. A247]|uniref:NUDIX hydrolase n=1 Tax=unclassified Sanguibacter TaxID=2645534 RepID=UPI003FD86D4A